MAAMIALLVRLIPGLGIVGSGFFITFVVTNIALGLFNLIPVPPLDGSRVIYAFAPDSIRDLFDRFERLGMMGILIFFFVIYPLVAGSLQGTIQFVSRYLLGL
jgi:Zn-dependent protease